MQSTEPVPACKYMELGDVLHSLQYETTNKYTWAVHHFNMFVALADLLGFDFPRDSFQRMIVFLRDRDEKATPEMLKAGVPADLANDIRKLVSPVAETIYREAAKRPTIVLGTHWVSAKLRGLPTHLANFNTNQCGLLEETTRCIECGAFRSAAVMAWNMAYDYVRQWIYDNHIADFNAALRAGYTRRNGTPVYEPINDYDDLLKSGSPAEREVLDTIKAAEKIPGKIHDELCRQLRLRNTYAHPSGKKPTIYQINSFVEDQIDVVVGPPFKP